MSKSNYEKALDIVNKALELPDKSVIFKHTGLNELKKAFEEAQKQERLLELYEELAERRLIVINRLLNEIIDLEDYGTVKDFIDSVMYEARYYGEVDTKITDEIAEIEEVQNETS